MYVRAMQAARIIGKAGALLLVAACSVSPSGTPKLTPPAALPLVAVVERDQVRLTIALDRNPMASGEEAWITTRLENLASTDLVWIRNNCTFTTWITADSSSVWRPGVPQPGNAGLFKAKALEDSGPGASRARLVFVPEDYLHAGSTHFGCPEQRQVTEVAAGEAIEQRARWDGILDAGFGHPVAGPYEILGMTQGTFSRSATGEPAIAAPTEVRLSAWVIDGRDPALLQPPEVIDAALGSESFLEYLTDARLTPSYYGRVRYDASSDHWLVGLINATTLRGLAATIDPIDGAVLEVADGRWETLAYRAP